MGERTPIDYLQKTPAQLNQLATNLPKLLQSYKASTPGFAQVDVDTAKLIDPQKLQATIDNYRKYGDTLAGINDRDLTRAALDQAVRDNTVASGPGADLLATTNTNQRLVNPEYYQGREFLSKKYQDVANSIGVDGLSGSEMAEIERGINRVAGPDRSNSRIIAAANTFGDRSLARKDSLTRALGNYAATLPSLKSGVDAFQVTSGKPSGSSTQGFNLGTSSGYLTPLATIGQNLLQQGTATDQANANIALQKARLNQQQQQQNTNLGLNIFSALKPTYNSGYGGGSFSGGSGGGIFNMSY